MSVFPQLTQADLFALIQRALPGALVDGWTDRDGEEVYQAIARVFSVLHGRDVARAESSYVLTATGPVQATATIKVTWTQGTTLAVEILTGQKIVQTPWGVHYQLTESLAAGAAEAPGYSATVGVEAVWAGIEPGCDEAPVDAEFLSEWGLPEGVDREGEILWDGAVAGAAKTEFLSGVDAGEITIEGVTDATGGKDGTLDLLAAGRGLPRVENEPDSGLRARIRQIPDVLTPGAILAVANAMLEPYGLTATMYEPWDYAFIIGSESSTIGDEDCAITRPRHFIISVPALSTYITDSTERAAFLAGMQASCDRIKAGGIWGVVYEDA